MVQRACDPSLHEPNYALNLELVEYIKKKKANTPREAAMAVVHNINHRNPHVSILALNLLQTLVNSLGHLFHLQIATKEFLNELVRRFPERPPPFPGPIMTRILDLIHEWKESICKESRWKEDLGNIKDMHRLLGYKGYRFRDAPRANQHSQSTEATANLKSPEELEQEDRDAQSAKLQELIRRGTPRDLAAAQELMKSLSGANPESKPDYRKQTMHELDKLQAKVILLNELLDNFDVSRGEKFAKGDAYDQVASVLRQARPKIQKWIGEAEEGDPESLDTFLHMNDMINNVTERYERFQKGDYSATIESDPSTSSATVPKDNLIDFFGDDDTATTAASASSAPANDLDGIFGPSAVVSSTSSPASPPPTNARANIMAAFNQPQASHVSQFGAPQFHSPAPTQFGAPTQTAAHLGSGAASPFGGAGTPTSQSQFGGIMLPTTPRPGSAAPSAPSSSQPPPQQGAKDPFADLAGLF
ncbi:putative ADP-ribosylation factor-binding protein C25H2,16c OS=Schizosaccharomyces pombe (strain 972 / ATCC 24843) GN=SPBC25H2.16c PE=1 SV=1 [Rhizoctonia solani AG-1 IB]|uniref:Putative ADP-ribosylation factor-binding protein C25H2,16c n=1 Tax=Thanatephorus cucumeris (strain AG1-IB / isolate 7/3/14) TaxID=1108050 RepID=A0A0B7G4R9_THACB|nr:putative ADP-ribosylation factor-binding protein C25H2,16c OS=Schizosaccharomyces pombe (strain 972 / ATCC 24843) GN=SPBC25H2.16c PE=1 SV=1 [Rhizoctonia solani AG-1 IB]